MTHFPPSALYERRRKFVRTLGMAVSALMVLIVVGILVLVARDRAAHDEVTCPFKPLSERAIQGGRIVEQERSCTAETTERRYMLERTGGAPREVAVRRLPPDRFRAERYKWEVTEDPEKGVTIQFSVDGKLTNEYRENDTGGP